MTDAATVAAKLDKLATNMDRIDHIVNGTAIETVATDGGTVPTFAKALSDFDGDFMFAATGAPWVRKSSDRARDYVRLIDFIPGAGSDLKDAIPGAAAALAAKGGGKLWLEGFRHSSADPIDLGAGSLTLNTNRITLAGEGETIIQSSAASGPVVTFGGNSSVFTTLPGAEGVRFYRTNTVAAGANDPIIWMRNCWEGHLDYCSAHAANDPINGGVGCMVDGGSVTGNYNSRFRGFKTYGKLVNGLVAGKTARVIGLYLTDGFSFGFTTGSALLIKDVDGGMISVGECLGAGLRALEMSPATGQHINSLQIDKLQLDTATEIGILLKDAGGTIENCGFANIWNATHGNTAIGGFFHEGIRIEGSVAPASWPSGKANICNLMFAAIKNCNNGAGGITTINCDNVGFAEVQNDGNGVNTTGFGWIIGSGVRNQRIVGGSARGRAFGLDGPDTVFQAYAASIATDTDAISVSGNADWSGNQFGPLAANTSTGTHNSGLSSPLGYHT
jgi:hypothetical protein